MKVAEDSVGFALESPPTEFCAYSAQLAIPFVVMVRAVFDAVVRTRRALSQRLDVFHPDDFSAELWRSPHQQWNMDDEEDDSVDVVEKLRVPVGRLFLAAYDSQSVYLLGHHAPAFRAATSS